MKRQIFILLISTVLFQCKEELPVAQPFPIVVTTSAISDAEGITFEGKVLNDGGLEILSYGFFYSRFVEFYDPGPGMGSMVYELGDPGDKTFVLKKMSIGSGPSYEYRAFVTYLDNSVKKTVYGNILTVESKVENFPSSGWNLIAGNEALKGNGEVLTAATGYRDGSILEAFFIQEDGKITKVDVSAGVISERPVPDFPLNANQQELKLYSVWPFVLNSQNNNVYTLEVNKWAIRTQLPFNHEELAAGGVYITQYYPHLYIFGSFGTHLYNYRDNNWETRTALPLSAGQSIVAGASHGEHYILTNDGTIWKFNEGLPSPLTTFPGKIDGRVVMFWWYEKLYVGLNNLSDQKMWQFDLGHGEWSEAEPFPETLNNPVEFSVYGAYYLANKKANGNYDIWYFGGLQ